MSAAVTGIYDTPTNRLVVYDYARNRSFEANRRRSAQVAKQIDDNFQRQRIIGSYNRRALDLRNDHNIGTMMHEVAHQLSFNGGLLNREGDAAAWVVEGLACYCEATAGGGWQGPGAANPARSRTLAAVVKNGSAFLPLRALTADDAWLRGSTSVQQVLLGYAQSWALFKMLMEERPNDLKRYLALIYPRRTPDHRLTDFAECFGDPDKLERHYQAYLREMARQARPEK
jgi:hypothetical protein